MFWMAHCLSLAGRPLSHQYVQKVNKAPEAVLRSERLCEKTCCCCGKCSVHKFIRNAFVPGSASYSSNWLPPMFLTIFSTFVQMFQGRKNSFLCLLPASICSLLLNQLILPSIHFKRAAWDSIVMFGALLLDLW